MLEENLDEGFNDDSSVYPRGPVIKTVKSRKTRPVNTKESVIILDVTRCYAKIPFFGHKYYSNKRVTLWLVKDCCGIVCVIITWLLMLYAWFVVSFVMLKPYYDQDWSYFLNTCCYQLLSFLALSSHIRAMVADPGAIVKGNATLENIRRMGCREGEVIFKCSKCLSIKPDRTHHCSVCKRCIRKMDHHCPWIDNCVGEGNQKYFILFTFYILLMCIHSWYIAICHLVLCIGSYWKACTWSQTQTTVMTIFMLIEGVIFGLFTASMLWTQLDAVFNDETGIELLKKGDGLSLTESLSSQNDQSNGGRGSHRNLLSSDDDNTNNNNDMDDDDDDDAEYPIKISKWLALKSVFGHPFSIRWFLPWVSPPVSYDAREDRMMGVDGPMSTTEFSCV